MQYSHGSCRWQSPLFVGDCGAAVLGGLSAAAADEGEGEGGGEGVAGRESDVNRAREALQRTAEQALDRLASTPAHPPQLPSLLHSHSFLPPPLGPSLSATIASTLRAGRDRSSSSHHSPSALTCTWTLATIMAHYFPDHFGQQTTGGVTTYARDPASDAAIHDYHRDVRHLRSDPNASGQDDDEQESDADRAKGVKTALLSIDRRDEKMRWLLGGTSHLAPELSSAPRRRSRSRPRCVRP